MRILILAIWLTVTLCRAGDKQDCRNEAVREYARCTMACKLGPTFAKCVRACKIAGEKNKAVCDAMD